MVNVRFRAEDVDIFDPRIVVPAGHVVHRAPRYHPINWNGSAPSRNVSPTALRAVSDDDLQADSSEELRHRAAVAGTTYSPEHARLQNALCHLLIRQHGAGAVRMEAEFVDVTVRTPAGTTFFEIKTAVTAKACIREAVGQLLEYGHYATNIKANRLVA